MYVLLNSVALWGSVRGFKGQHSKILGKESTVLTSSFTEATDILGDHFWRIPLKVTR